MSVSLRFVLGVHILFCTAWGNQYQDMYQKYQQQYHPPHNESHSQSAEQKHHLSEWHPWVGNVQQPQQEQPSLDALNEKKPPVSPHSTWGSPYHGQSHTHAGHVHAPHKHHPAHGSRVRQEDKEVFRRPYCRARPATQCCPGRDDTCAMPILGTICYCDAFCNRTVADCCPDFWTHCMGIAPPPRALGHGHLQHTKKEDIVNNCNYKGMYSSPGMSIRINCNNCTCVDAGITAEYNWKCSQKICLIRKELIEHVNKGGFGWKAGNYTFYWGMTLSEGVQFRLGTQRPMSTVKEMTSLRVHINDVLPEKFDAREEWPNSIHPIQDQGNCGSSWAFSTTSVMSDRLSIHSGGAIRDMLSPQQLLSCNKDFMQHGCEGGHLDRAWWYVRKVGVVNSACYPYRSGVTSEAGMCLVPGPKLTVSRLKCPTKNKKSSHVYQASPPYRIAPNEREIMKEILENGPVQATMEIKEDFFMYEEGVYRYSLPANILPPNHRRTGFHSFKILGWGVDNSSGKRLKYWLCANSWGPKWGEGGYFRVARGTDECKVESFVVGAWGRMNGRSIMKRRRKTYT